MPTERRRRALLLAALLAGCHVPDRTDVPVALGGAPPPPPAAAQPPPPPPAGPPPLLRIGSAAGVDYQPALAAAVAAARARKPDVAFDVVDTVPATGGPQRSVAAAAAATPQAAGVARAIVALGVPAARVSLAARSDAALTAPEVRVYVH